MKDDALIIVLLTTFIDKSLPMLNIIEANETRIRNEMRFYNRKQKKKEIRDAYNGYLGMVVKSWEMIYLSSKDFHITIENTQYLVNNQSIYARTRIQQVAEQFFFSLVYTIGPIIDYYDGKMKEETANQMSNASREHMHEMMKAYDAIALENLKQVQHEKAEEKKQQNKEEQVATQALSDEEERIKGIIRVLNEYRPLLYKEQLKIAEMNLPVRQYAPLNMAGVQKVADVFKVKPAELIRVGPLHLSFILEKAKVMCTSSDPQAIEILKQKEKNIIANRQEIRRFTDGHIKRLVFNTNPQVQRIEQDYKQQAQSLQTAFSFTDFSAFSNRWRLILESAESTKSEITSYLSNSKTMDFGDVTGVVEQCMALLSNIVSIYNQLLAYANLMEQLTMGLAERSEGRSFNYKQYKELYDKSEIAKKKYQDIITPFSKKYETLNPNLKS